MTVPELISAYSEYNQLSVMLLGTLLTLVSAYLVATFLAVEKLSWFQLSVISAMFVLFSADLAMGMYFHWEMAISIHNELMIRVRQEDSPDGFLFAPEGSRSAVVPLLISLGSIVLSVAFAIQSKRKWSSAQSNDVDA